MYVPTRWEDHVTSMPGVVEISPYDKAKNQYTFKLAGTVQTEGTPQDQTHFNNMETGIHDISIAVALLLNHVRQNGWGIERGTVTLTNHQQFPFNDSAQTVPLENRRENENYVVLTEVVSFNGNVGELDISDKLTNGFKLGYTGSAKTATVKYIVIGGY